MICADNGVGGTGVGMGAGTGVGTGVGMGMGVGMGVGVGCGVAVGRCVGVGCGVFVCWLLLWVGASGVFAVCGAAGDPCERALPSKKIPKILQSTTTPMATKRTL